MKKESRSFISKILSVIAIGIVMGISFFAVAISMFAVTMTSELWHMAVIIPSVIVEYFILTAAHECGHLFFGLISGYRFSSYRIGGLMWIKLPDGIKLCRMSIAGTGGQCLMTPPEAKNGKIPVFLYNFGGSFVNFILAAVMFAIYFASAKLPILPQIMIMGGTISLIMAFLNGVPMKVGGISNDGMNAFSLRKNTYANEAFNKQLLINAEQTRGTRLSDMPKEWFELSLDADMNNPICATIPAFYCNRLMDQGRFDDTEKSILALINGNNGLLGMYRGMLISDLIYCLLLKGENDKASKYYTKEQRTFMNALRGLPGILRTEYALAVCKIEGAQNAEKIKKLFNKTIKKYPYPSDAELEQKLIALIEEKTKIEK